jgi:hypothetical protein
MKHFKPFLMVMVVSLVLTGYSQELPRHVFCTGGDHHKTAVVELSWTIGQGEPEATTYHPNVILCSGFQQQDDMLVSVEDIRDEHCILFYPNPSPGQGILELSFETPTEVNYVLYDLHGRALISKKLQNSSNYRENIDLYHLSPGIYNLFVTKGGNASDPVRSIKIFRK